MVRIVFHVLLVPRCQRVKRKQEKRETYFRWIYISVIGAETLVFGVCRSGQRPHLQSMITAAPHNQQTLGSLFPGHDAIFPFHLDPLRSYDCEASNSARVAPKRMSACPVDRSQMRTVRSVELLTSVSLRAARAHTPPLWPSKERRSSPVTGEYTWME